MRSMNGWASAPTGTAATGGARRHRARPVAGAAITTMLVAIGLPLAAISASAVVPAGHTINVFPARDMVTLTGYASGDLVAVNVRRQGFLMSSSNAVAGADGSILINEPPTFPDKANCWGTPALNVTPDIQVGDMVEAIPGGTTIVAGVTVTQQATFVGSTVTIKGTAPGAVAGTRLPALELEARINAKNTKFAASNGGGASIRALNIPTKPGEGTLNYDSDVVGSPGYATWTATWTGMNVAGPDGQIDGLRAAGSGSVGVWTAGTLTETTNFEVGPAQNSFVKGPMGPDCSAPAATGPTTPAMTAATVTGASSTDAITSNLTPTFAGAAGSAGATSVNLYVDAPPAPAPLPATPDATGPVSGGTYSVALTTPLTPGTHTITVGVVGPNTGVPVLRGTLAATAVIDTTAPVLTSFSPVAGAVGISPFAWMTANFSEPVQFAPGAFTLSSATGPVQAAVTFGGAALTPTLTPLLPLAPATVYTVALTSGATDLAGNALAPISWTFTTAVPAPIGPAPFVSVRSPVSNQKLVRQTANTYAAFSENVTGVTGGTFTLKKTSSGAAVGATVIYDATNHVATLNPTAALAPGSWYTATLSTGIKDADALSIPATSWNFATSPRPTITRKSPAANAAPVSLRANVTATFSEYVRNFSSATFTLKSPTGKVISGAISFNSRTHVATFNPRRNLARNTRYTARLSSLIKDSDGNSIPTTSWRFTTFR